MQTQNPKDQFTKISSLLHHAVFLSSNLDKTQLWDHPIQFPIPKPLPCSLAPFQNIKKTFSHALKLGNNQDYLQTLSSLLIRLSSRWNVYLPFTICNPQLLDFCLSQISLCLPNRKMTSDVLVTQFLMKTAHSRCSLPFIQFSQIDPMFIPLQLLKSLDKQKIYSTIRNYGIDLMNQSLQNLWVFTLPEALSLRMQKFIHICSPPFSPCFLQFNNHQFPKIQFPRWISSIERKLIEQFHSNYNSKLFQNLQDEVMFLHHLVKYSSHDKISILRDSFTFEIAIFNPDNDHPNNFSTISKVDSIFLLTLIHLISQGRRQIHKFILEKMFSSRWNQSSVFPTGILTRLDKSDYMFPVLSQFLSSRSEKSLWYEWLKPIIQQVSFYHRHIVLLNFLQSLFKIPLFKKFSVRIGMSKNLSGTFTKESSSLALLFTSSSKSFNQIIPLQFDRSGISIGTVALEWFQSPHPTGSDSETIHQPEYSHPSWGDEFSFSYFSPNGSSHHSIPALVQPVHAVQFLPIVSSHSFIEPIIRHWILCDTKRTIAHSLFQYGWSLLTPIGTLSPNIHWNIDNPIRCSPKLIAIPPDNPISPGPHSLIIDIDKTTLLVSLYIYSKRPATISDSNTGLNPHFQSKRTKFKEVTDASSSTQKLGKSFISFAPVSEPVLTICPSCPIFQKILERFLLQFSLSV